MATVLTHLPCRSRVPHFSKNALQIQQYITTLCLCSPVRRISRYYGRVGDISKDASTVYYGNYSKHIIVAYPSQGVYVWHYLQSKVRDWC